jgi:hypothetical protein
MVVACLALVVALGGTSYAAFSIPANSVGTKQLRNRAVTSAKIAPATLRALGTGHGTPGPVGPTGPKGATGAAGATGQVGPAGAGYARYSAIPGSGAPGGFVTLTSRPDWADVISTSVTLQRTSYILINAQFQGATASTTQQTFIAQVVVDGTPLPGVYSSTTTISNGVHGAHFTLPVSDVLTMTRGTHTITLQGQYLDGNATPVAYDRTISAVDEG